MKSYNMCKSSDYRHHLNVISF